MRHSGIPTLVLALLSLNLLGSAAPPSESYDPGLLGEMRWRQIGPFRGGRTKAAAGIPDRPNVFYVGVCNGGVWKTTDYGITWHPIFDDQPTGSIGAIAIAPSNPDILYVGSGEGLQRPDLSTGDGIYKSLDGGRNWTHLGLRDGQQIPQIIVDPRNPDRLFVAVLGHPYGPNPQRGIFRSLDGGRSFQKVLYKDENTGGVDVVFDPTDSNTIYAVLWEARQGPWENGEFSGPGSGIFKSTDGGDNWKPLKRGLPTFADDGLGRIGITVAPSDPHRLFATVDANRNRGLYRSDDGGESWTRINADPRVTQRGSDFAEVKVHPDNPDIVFTGSIVVWKSTDGGRTFEAIRGAPGGDDYHRIWINPKNPDIMLVAADQGAIVTVNGGESWSSWYNQPTAQFYHVSTDNAFPYRVCGGQQESGSACVQSRGDDGQITFREWHPVGVEEYGYVAADPLDPDIVYGGKVSRYDRRTGQVQNVGPMPLRGESGYRVIRTMPLLFSPLDPHTLYFASNTLWKTANGGDSWDRISPDLSRESWDVPANVGKYSDTPPARPPRRGVIYTIAPSYVDSEVIWVGTDDGLIHRTSDGGRNWENVTPQGLLPWAKVSLMDASHSDVDTAYAAINTLRLDDLRPHIYRTRDGGRSWTHIAEGIPDGGTVNAVREDPQRKGLLFAGTEQAVYVSFDDGDSWQSLRLNMPATSIRDLVIKDDDLVVGTHGRGFWILDDITPLRQISPRALDQDAFLFAPQQAWRFRWNKNTDTPLPAGEPAGDNPPDGAILHYFLKSAQGPVTLEILTDDDVLIRRYSSQDPPEPPLEGQNVPAYWPRPARVLSAESGLHRFVWDLHYPRPAGARLRYPISAIPHNTPVEPTGPWVLPGSYVVRLTVGGRVREQKIEVRMDPRVQTSEAELRYQFETSMRVYEMLRACDRLLRQISTFRDSKKFPDADSQAADLEGSFRRLQGELGRLFNTLEDVDRGPTASVVEALAVRRKAFDEAKDAWAVFAEKWSR